MSEFFPQDIIVEILSRLPVKPLCRFKCVSKPWSMLITDPKFIETHTAKRQNQTLIVANQQLFSVSFEPFERKGGSICDLEALELYHPLKSKAPNLYFQICGSCNGFICLLPVVMERYAEPPNVFIFNPCIGMFKQVPVNDDLRLPASHRDVYGFGYAPSIDDYKLIKIAPSSLVAVYSFKMNSWKTLEKFPLRYLSGSSTWVNGAVHWVVRRRFHDDGVGRLFIAAFDVANECFKEVDIPDDLSNNLLMIGALNGSLCLMHDSIKDTLANEFWIMREYEVKESWCKIVMDVSYKCMKPMCLMKNGEALLLINNERFVLCDLKDGKCTDFVVRGLPNRYVADMCVETLVFPNLIKWFGVV